MAQELGQLYASDITYPNVEYDTFCQEHTWISSVLLIELAHSKYLRIDLVVLGWCFFIFQLILFFFLILFKYLVKTQVASVQNSWEECW